MFGAFKPSAPLSGGLLWKIPYRLSAPQKLRHRRRLRHVDNVVSTLDNALKRQTPSMAQASQHSTTAEPAQLPNQHQYQSGASGKATPEELSATAEGQRMIEREVNADQEARRHGRGPRQGEMVPEFTEHGVEVPSTQPLIEQARMHGTIKLIERWKAEMPTEQEMLPRDKYTMFDKKAKKYRKGVHKLPKWTRVSQRLNPPGF
ncbi:uncharacterized protein LTR77_005152 [Saxophila tyrrhenica]|uniref:54S ribosomal protein L31, mitochondrial n=1 Tax=Saxophila tyrrhenica TaxID=1690608 RepID=A0AAV9PB20_9PEZI|nr:hypothetical protein LTR77_005152 [Saxophila tyrrhenica]